MWLWCSGLFFSFWGKWQLSRMQGNGKAFMFNQKHFQATGRPGFFRKACYAAMSCFVFSNSTWKGAGWNIFGGKTGVRTESSSYSATIGVPNSQLKISCTSGFFPYPPCCGNAGLINLTHAYITIPADDNITWSTAWVHDVIPAGFGWWWYSEIIMNLLQRGIIHVTIPYNQNTEPVEPHPPFGRGCMCYGGCPELPGWYVPHYVCWGRTANIVWHLLSLSRNGNWTICLTKMLCICLHEMETPNIWFLAWIMSHNARGVHLVMGVGSLLH